MTRWQTTTGLILGAAIILGACVGSPDLPPTDRQTRGDAPQLVPISGLLDHADQPDGVSAAELSAAPKARASALRARAARLRGPVIAQPDRARLLASGPSLR
ncbi:MAG: hypothetical protein GVY34_01700 [Alphaproteobacteria bacterium]|jgi:hypothetical protein|nr:hypothetical protein [Alphaproteobacteria bacterium]